MTERDQAPVSQAGRVIVSAHSVGHATHTEKRFISHYVIRQHYKGEWMKNHSQYCEKDRNHFIPILIISQAYLKVVEDIYLDWRMNEVKIGWSNQRTKRERRK